MFIGDQEEYNAANYKVLAVAQVLVCITNLKSHYRRIGQLSCQFHFVRLRAMMSGRRILIYMMIISM